MPPTHKCPSIARLSQLGALGLRALVLLGVLLLAGGEGPLLPILVALLLTALAALLRVAPYGTPVAQALLLADVLVWGWVLNTTSLGVAGPPVAGVLALVSSPLLGWRWGAVYALGVYAVWAWRVPWAWEQHGVLALWLGANLAVSALTSITLAALDAQLAAAQSVGPAQVAAVRARTKAITRMANELSASLRYNLVLDAAMDIGTLALHHPDQGGLMGAVLLYRLSDEALYVVSSRGLPRGDELRMVGGVSGVVGRALKECVPLLEHDPAYDPELRVFAGFGRAASVLVLPLRAGYDNYGVLLFGSRVPGAFDEQFVDLMEAVGTQATIALQNAALYENLAEEKERIVAVEEEARKRLASDLHDGPTQSIAGVVMRSGIIRRMLERGQGDQVTDELRRIEALAQQATTEMRHMLFALRPLALETTGLGSALDQLKDKLEAAYDQVVDVTVSHDAEEALTPQQQGLVFYIVEEALGNARKHAKARSVRVTTRRQEDVVLVDVKDDGRGFNVAEVQEAYSGRGSLGMLTMRERAQMMDAVLEVNSAPGRGTTISVIIPVDAQARRRNGQPRERFALHAIRPGRARSERAL